MFYFVRSFFSSFTSSLSSPLFPHRSCHWFGTGVQGAPLCHSCSWFGTGVQGLVLRCPPLPRRRLLYYRLKDLTYFLRSQFFGLFRIHDKFFFVAWSCVIHPISHVTVVTPLLSFRRPSLPSWVSSLQNFRHCLLFFLSTVGS